MPFGILLAVLFLVFPALIIAAVVMASKQLGKDELEQGRELLESGQPEQALRVFERMSKTAARSSLARERALYWLGRSYEELGREGEARAVYSRTLEETRARPFTLDADLERLVRERLARLSGEAPTERSRTGYWQQFNAERGRTVEEPPRTAEPPVRLVEAPRAEPPPLPRAEPRPVDLARLAGDEAQLARGRRIGDYILAEKLGEGGFGEVYRALKPVAIKLARDPAVIEHLRRFGTIQSQVDSDRVVRPLEINLEADPPYVVMELVDGFTLRDLLETRKLAPEVALAVAREVALGLKDAHEQGVLHLDLKPENVLLDEDGKVKITDFDLGRMTPESAQFRLSRSLGSSEKDAKIAGTIAYMSPEQRDGKMPDQRSDIYTFGVLLFEAITGEHPQPGDKPSELEKGLPQGAELDRIFERCFTRLERRYATVADLVRDLEAVTAKLPAVDLAAAFRAAPEARSRVAARTRAWASEPKARTIEVPPPAAEPRKVEPAPEKAVEARPPLAVEPPPIPVEPPPLPQAVRPPLEPMVEAPPLERAIETPPPERRLEAT